MTRPFFEVDMSIIYEPHPVTAERKAELLAQGYKIIDARFAPEEAPIVVPDKTEDASGATPRRGHKAKG